MDGKRNSLGICWAIETEKMKNDVSMCLGYNIYCSDRIGFDRLVLSHCLRAMTQLGSQTPSGRSLSAHRQWPVTMYQFLNHLSELGWLTGMYL